MVTEVNNNFGTSGMQVLEKFRKKPNDHEWLSFDYTVGCPRISLQSETEAKLSKTF